MHISQQQREEMGLIFAHDGEFWFVLVLFIVHNNNQVQKSYYKCSNINSSNAHNLRHEFSRWQNAITILILFYNGLFCYMTYY